MAWDQLAADDVIERTCQALNQNGIATLVVETAAQAKAKVLEIIPAGAEVMNVTSTTLDTAGVSPEIQDSGRYESVRKLLFSVSDKESRDTARRKSGSPEWVVGSVHAVTEQGHVVVASATGSQLPPYAYGATQVIWVVGTQKIVPDMESAMVRLQDYTFPLEDSRARKAYGMGSGINKLLIVNREIAQGRVTLIFVKEKLGF